MRVNSGEFPAVYGLVALRFFFYGIARCCLKDVKVDGESKGAINKVTFDTSDYSQDHTVTAEFEKLTYTLTIVNGEDSQTSTVDYGKRNAAAAPTKAGLVFTGWKVENSDPALVYYAGQKFNVTGNMTLTAQWPAVENWSKDPSETENPGKLDVDVDVKVDVAVAVNVGVAANAAVATSKDTLGNDIRDMLKNVVTNDASVSDNIGKANELHALLNKGASDIDANLTVSAVLQSTPTEDELKTLISEAFDSSEQPQKWELSVTLNTVAKDASNLEIGRVESAPIKKTNTPIVFTLTTGQNLTGKDVRVLHVLDSNGSTEVANSTVKDAVYGVVEVTASSFSPYIILAKDKPSSGHHSSGGSSVSSYPVSVTAPTNGKLTADKSSAVKGAIVTLTVTPDQDYELSRLTVTDKDGKEIVLTDKGNGKYAFVMPSGKVSVSAAFGEVKSSSAFVDVPADACYEDGHLTKVLPAAWTQAILHRTVSAPVRRPSPSCGARRSPLRQTARTRLRMFLLTPTMPMQCSGRSRKV